MAENYGSLTGTLDAHDTLEGNLDNHGEMSGEVQFGGAGSKVDDVLVNGESVVENKIAHIDLTPYAEIENVYDKTTIDTALGGKADVEDIPTDLFELHDDADHRTVTDAEKTEWSGKADTSDIPTALSQLTNDDNYVQDEHYQHTDNNYTDNEKSKLADIESGAEANVQSDWNESDTSSDAYILNKPTIPSVVANPQNTTATLTSIGIDGTNYAIQGGGGGGAVNSVNGMTGDVVLDAEDVGALPDDTPLFSGDYNDLTNKPTIPDELADLQDDSTHRLVTDTEKTTWNNKSDFSGSYNDLTDKPTIPDAQIQSDWEQSDNTKVDFIKNKPTIPSAQVNSDWDASSGVAEILNKPTLGTASALDVAISGDASTTEVVKGDDSRLTDSRTPTSHTHTKSDITDFPTLGTASEKDVPVSGNASNTEVVLGSDTRLTDARTPVSHTHTTSDITDFPTMSDYIEKSNTSGFVKNDGSIDTNSYLNSTLKGTSNGVAELDSNGKVPSSQLPSYVDDVIEGYYDSVTDRFYEESTFEHVITPESGKSWVDVATNKSYRWTGSVYTRVDEGVQLGETSSTAYRGDRGKTAYDHSQLTSGNPHNVTASDVGLGNVDNTSDSTKKSNFTGTIADDDTGFVTGGDVYDALANKVDKVNGKQLSTEDYTTAEKTKLSGISTGANKTEASTTNGNIKIDNVETPVYRLKGNNTVLSTDRTPYLLREALSVTNASAYVREKLIGCSVAWNQLFEDGNLIDATKWGCSGGTFTISGNVATITCTTAGNVVFAPAQNISTLVNHKYYVCATIKSTNGKQITLQTPYTSSGTEPTTTSTSFTKLETIGYRSSDYTGKFPRIAGYSMAVGEKFEVKLLMYIDLTLAFGSSVADTLYAMTNNGGIDWLRNHNYPIDQYTQYGYGLYSSKPSAKKVVGKNLIDESTYQLGDAAHGSMSKAFSQSDNRPYLKAGTQFVLSSNGVGAGNAWISVSTKPNSSDISEFISIDFISGRGFSNGNPIIGTMPVSGYLAFSIQNIYGNLENAKAFKLQLEVGSTKTAYEPYIGVTYSLGSTELRGKFNLVNGEIVASGDVKESNGVVTRNYGIVDLGTQEWTYISSGNRFTSSGIANLVKKPASDSQKVDMVSLRLIATDLNTLKSSASDYLIAIGDTGVISVRYTASGTDATAFKTAMDGVYLVYPLATPTTETSSPFADPMSLNGCTTEEYVDDRSIPVPVGHETQYMGQSEDVVEIPSMPLADGKRVLTNYTSGGESQMVWEGVPIVEDISDLIVAASGVTNFKATAKRYEHIVSINIEGKMSSASGTLCKLTNDIAIKTSPLDAMNLLCMSYSGNFIPCYTQLYSSNVTNINVDNAPTSENIYVTATFVI